ncbi:MAG: Histidinol-phosphate aminotransferase [Fimbriimonadaceae bacterium]|nr:Histidinol-phosphate aminotransferase [Fimbriimonadaceae bacterium]
MQPYSPGKPIDEVQRELGLTEVIKLASNENPLGPPPKAVEAAKHAVESLHVYPDASAFRLREALANHVSLPMESILVGNGSDELIHILGEVFLGGPDDAVVVGSPSFVRYDAAAELANCRLVRVPLDAELRHDLDAMALAITPRTRLVFVANPNNPTGTIVDGDGIRRLVSKLAPGSALVLDEAYFEFAQDAPGYPNSRDLVAEGLPVIGLRTFSKTYGLAGIRLGYMMAPPEIIDACNRAREPFNTNAVAQAAALGALTDQEHLQATVANNRRQLERMTQAFTDLGLRCIPSYANFLLVDLGRPAEPVFHELLKKGVIVRSGHVLGLPTYLRISVGTEAETDRLIEAMNQIAPIGEPA